MDSDDLKCDFKLTTTITEATRPALGFYRSALLPLGGRSESDAVALLPLRLTGAGGPHTPL